MSAKIIPVSAVIPTRNRSAALQRTLASLFTQSALPHELILVDASADGTTREMISTLAVPGGMNVIYRKAVGRGAAVQRMEGITVATQATIFFMDDDLIFEVECIDRLWLGLSSEENVGAVNAMITNQRYTPPGALTRIMYRLMSGEKKPTFAGRVIGPAWNLLPEDREDLPPYVRCDWLNTTCTMYRRDCLPDPVFDPYFTGYSMMEDMALSLVIGRSHTLLNARTARIHHDSQPGDHKDGVVALSEMEFRNRRFVMTQVLSRNSFTDHMKLLTFEMFSLLSSFRTKSTIRLFPRLLLGKIKALLPR